VKSQHPDCRSRSILHLRLLRTTTHPLAMPATVYKSSKPRATKSATGAAMRLGPRVPKTLSRPHYRRVVRLPERYYEATDKSSGRSQASSGRHVGQELQTDSSVSERLIFSSRRDTQPEHCT
jgi:hypothetical protein